MLLHGSRCQDAPQQSLEKERRLLWFADKGQGRKQEAEDEDEENTKTQGQKEPSSKTEDEEDEGTPAKKESPQEKPDTTAGVKDAQKKTRQEAQNTMESDKDKPTPQSVGNKIEKATQTFAQMQVLLKMPDVKTCVAALGKEDQKQWEENLSFLDKENNILGNWSTLNSDIEKFLQGDWEPEKLFETLRETYRNVEGGEIYVQDMQKYIDENKGRFANWAELPKEQKIEIIAEFSQGARIEGVLNQINERMDTYLASIEEHKKAIGKMQAWTMEQNEGAPSGKKYRSGLGIKFYSILEVWEALKMVKDNYVKAWNDRSRLKSTQLAQKMGAITAWDPFFGEQVGRNLTQQAEGEKKKIANEEKEFLEDPPMSFDKTIDRLHAYVGIDPPRARGVLEYAAGRGWLYDISASAGTGDKSVFGISFSQICSDWDEERTRNYFVSLRGKNTAGRAQEQQRRKDEFKAVDDFDGFKKGIETQLANINLWGALGVMESACERGKAGETNARMAVSLLSAIRTNPNIRKYINDNMLDAMGKTFLGKIPFTLASLQTDRTDIVRWAKAGATDELMAGGGTIASTIYAIEQKLPGKNSLNHETLDDIVAQVLATKTVCINETCISIFDPAFNNYRKNNPAAFTAPTNFKGQEDYTINNPYSEFLLTLKNVYGAVFEMGTNGNFQNPDEASNLAKRLCEKHDELEKMGPKMKKTLDNFKEEAKQKLTEYFKGALGGGQPRDKIMFTHTANIGGRNELILDAFLKRGLLIPRELETPKTRDIIGDLQRRAGLAEND